MLRTRDSKKNENMAGWPIEGIPVKRQVGMIYWYSWGDHEFDIRVMRRVLGLPSESSYDDWFKAKTADPCGSFCNIMAELFLNLEDKSFAEAMVRHDALLEADAEADRVLRAEARKEFEDRRKAQKEEQNGAGSDKTATLVGEIDKVYCGLENFGTLMLNRYYQARDTARKARKKGDLKKWDKFNAVARAYYEAYELTRPIRDQLLPHLSDELCSDMLPF